MSGITKMLKKDIFLLILIGVAFAASAYFYPRLPAQVPSHWNLQGQVDGYSSRFWGAFALPLMMAGLYLLFFLLPVIDPRKENYAKFSRAYTVFKYALILLFFGLYLMVILAALGYALRSDLIFPVGFNLLFIVMGNYLTTVRPNYFCGIRTPWTLANEEVWRKTHRVGGMLFVASGGAGLILSLINARWGGMASFGLIIGTSLYTVFYSWWYFQKVNRLGKV